MTTVSSVPDYVAGHSTGLTPIRVFIQLHSLYGKLNPTKEWAYENLLDQTEGLIYGEDGQARVLVDPLRCIFRSSEVEDAVSETPRRTHSRNYYGQKGAGLVDIGVNKNYFAF